MVFIFLSPINWVNVQDRWGCSGFCCWYIWQAGCLDVVPKEEEDVHAHAAMFDQLPVAVDVFQVTHQTQLEEYHRVDALLPAMAVINTG